MTTSLNQDRARIVDPVLTAAALAYQHPERAGIHLFPTVDVPARGGRIIQFDKRSFRLTNAKRSPGADTKSIQLGYEGDSYFLVQDALDASVPREHMQEAETVSGVKMASLAVETVMSNLTLSLEYEQAKLATNEANYGDNNKRSLDAADQFSNPDSDPEKVIDDAKEVVRLLTGSKPNVLLVPKPAFRALKRHPLIKERFKYTSSDSITTKMLAQFFDMDKLVVGKSVMLEGPSDDAPFVDVWGNHAVLTYVPQSQTGFGQPSFGYTYTLKGCPMVEKPEWVGGKKSWLCGVVYERAPVMCGPDSGFLLSNVISSE